MKIEAEVKSDRITIDDLVGGDTFYFAPSGTLWMKTIIEYKAIEAPDGMANAISLDDGTLSYFSKGDAIIPIKTKVVNA